MKSPTPVTNLWGIWIPNGGNDGAGCWMGCGDHGYNAVEVYTDKTEAGDAAESYQRDFPGCTVHRIAPGDDLIALVAGAVSLLHTLADDIANGAVSKCSTIWQTSKMHKAACRQMARDLEKLEKECEVQP